MAEDKKLDAIENEDDDIMADLDEQQKIYFQRLESYNWVDVSDDILKEAVTKHEDYNSVIKYVSLVEKEEKKAKEQNEREQRRKQKELADAAKLQHELEKKIAKKRKQAMLKKEKIESDSSDEEAKDIPNPESEAPEEPKEEEQTKQEYPQKDPTLREEVLNIKKQKPKPEGMDDIQGLQFTANIPKHVAKTVVANDIPIIYKNINSIEQQVEQLRLEEKQKREKDKERISELEEQVIEDKKQLDEKLENKKEEELYIEQQVNEQLKKSKLNLLAQSIVNRNVI